MHHRHTTQNDEPYDSFTVTTSRGAYSDKKPCLRPLLTPTMGPVQIDELRIPFTTELIPDNEQDLPIMYQLHAVDYSTSTEHTTLEKIQQKTH
jgi:hypothetical protein